MVRICHISTIMVLKVQIDTAKRPYYSTALCLVRGR